MYFRTGVFKGIHSFGGGVTSTVEALQLVEVNLYVVIPEKTFFLLFFLFSVASLGVGCSLASLHGSVSHFSSMVRKEM